MFPPRSLDGRFIFPCCVLTVSFFHVRHKYSLLLSILFPDFSLSSPFLLGGLEPIGLLALVGEHGSVIPDTLYYEGLCPKTGWWWTSMGLAEVDGMYQLPRWLYKIQNKTDSTDIDS